MERKSSAEKKREVQEGSLKLGYIEITIHLFKLLASNKLWLFDLNF